ncbi:hypothetical protein ACFIOY_26770 [Bradyrhizobium sp. TZ2]
MKKFLLGTVALVAFAAPAAAADLAARPYTKAPPMIAALSTGAVSTSAPTAVGVRAATAGTSCRLPAVLLPRVAMMRPAAPPVA